VSRHDATVVFASEHETVGQVFEKLMKYQFLSLPIYNDDRKFIGFIDILDILSYLCTKIVDYQQGLFRVFSSSRCIF
jgi:CBS domain containing-hemolysin-like protein